MSAKQNIAHNVGYHASRRNGLANIFEDVDVTMVSRLCLEDSGCSSRLSESQLPWTDVSFAKLGDTKTRSSCLQHTEVSEADPIPAHTGSPLSTSCRRVPNDTKIPTTATQTKREKVMNRNNSSCSDHTENLYAMAGECAKRPLIF